MNELNFRKKLIEGEILSAKGILLGHKNILKDQKKMYKTEKYLWLIPFIMALFSISIIVMQKQLNTFDKVVSYLIIFIFGASFSLSISLARSSKLSIGNNEYFIKNLEQKLSSLNNELLNLEN